MRTPADAVRGREVPVQLGLGAVGLEVDEGDDRVRHAVLVARPYSSQAVSSTGSGPL